MTTARHILALVKSQVDGDDSQFYSVAIQVAAQEARQGHGKVAQEIRELIDEAKASRSAIVRRPGPVPLAQPKGDLANLLTVRYPDERLSSMVLTAELEARLRRILHEQKQQDRLRAHGLTPRRKVLLLGPPGSGKTMTAAALAGELRLPLFTVVLDGLITKFMGETASKLRLVFDAMGATRGVYFFDEFDAIGARRATQHDVGEIRRVLNSFLQFLEQDESQGLIVAATNHPELLDPALFRRFDDVIEYSLPDPGYAERLLKTRLAAFDVSAVEWAAVVDAATGLSHAEITRAADEAAKAVLLDGQERITTEWLLQALTERKHAMRRAYP
jgi:SpoVK/Ycf46/Vps4 family AAA+-type ATPase